MVGLQDTTTLNPAGLTVSQHKITAKLKFNKSVAKRKKEGLRDGKVEDNIFKH